MSDTLRWGILGAGGIARTFATGVSHSATGRVIAIASRATDRAEAFGREMNVPRRYGSYEAILADGEVQAVYVATPHPQHLEWTVKAADAGKHVLCEKPLGINAAKERQSIDAARRNDVLPMEAFMYRCPPQTAKVSSTLRH